MSNTKKKNRKIVEEIDDKNDVHKRNERLNQLKEMFNNMDMDVISLVFAENDYDFDKTIETLTDFGIQEELQAARLDDDVTSPSTSGTDSPNSSRSSSLKASMDDEDDMSDTVFAYMLKDQDDITEEEAQLLRRSLDSIKATEDTNGSSIRSELVTSKSTWEEKIEFLSVMFPDCEESLLHSLLQENDGGLKETVESLLPLSLMNMTSLDQLKQQQDEEIQAMEEVKKAHTEAHTKPEFTGVPEKKGTWAPLTSAWNGKLSPKPTQGTEAKPQDRDFSKKVEMLREMFPTAAYYALATRLEENHEDYQKTIENILSDPLPDSSHVPSNWKERKDGPPNDIATKLRFKVLKDQFVWVTEDILQSVYYFNDFNLTKTIKALGELYPSALPGRKTQQNTHIAVQEIQNKIAEDLLLEEDRKRIVEEEDKRKSQKKFQTATKKKKKGPKKTPDAEYRDQTMKHAKFRDEFFRAAAQAYMHGSHDVAKALSEAGRRHHNLMKQFQEKSSEEIFKHSLENNVGRATKIDFHGLLVSDALRILRELITQMQKRNAPQLLEVVTGAGKHSADGVARIKPAVESFLMERGFKFNPVNEGSLLVLITQ